MAGTPDGRGRWTLELLSELAVKRGFVASHSKSEVALWLNEYDLKPWRKTTWCVPKLTGEFRERMKDVLDQYEKPYDPKEPVIGFDAFEAGPACKYSAWSLRAHRTHPFMAPCCKHVRSH